MKGNRIRLRTTIETGPIVKCFIPSWFCFSGVHWVIYLNLFPSEQAHYSCFTYPHWD